MEDTRYIVGESARWQVMWIDRQGVINEKDFGNDLYAARRFYVAARDKGVKSPTLRCCNVGFAVPTKYEDTMLVDKVKVVKRGGKRYKQTVKVEVDNPNGITNLNHRGIWWCPYCCELREFERESRGTRIVMFCPMCEVTNLDFHVRKYNPMAVNIAMRKKTKGRRRGSRR